MNIDKKTRERFFSNVQAGTGDACWLWTANTFRGYGRLWVNGKTQRAHRVAYEIAFGKFPKTMCVCHACDNPGCVNPKHLFLGTQIDNLLDMSLKGRRRFGHVTGERHGQSKLDSQQVLEIKKRLAMGQSRASLAELFRVGRTAIANIATGVRWKHVLFPGSTPAGATNSEGAA